MSNNVRPTYATLSKNLEKEQQAANNATRNAMKMSFNTENSAKTNWQTRMKYKKEFPQLTTFIKTLNNKKRKYAPAPAPSPSPAPAPGAGGSRKNRKSRKNRHTKRRH
jgi:hypothetical protein